MTLGWWWADPIAALAIALVAIREGTEADTPAVHAMGSMIDCMGR